MSEHEYDECPECLGTLAHLPGCPVVEKPAEELDELEKRWELARTALSEACNAGVAEINKENTDESSYQEG